MAPCEELKKHSAPCNPRPPVSSYLDVGNVPPVSAGGISQAREWRENIVCVPPPAPEQPAPNDNDKTNSNSKSGTFDL
jgi:hypothetical protein